MIRANLDVRQKAARHDGGTPMSRSRARLKLIAIGFNAYGTGLTRVMHSIMRRLADRHEIHYLGIGYSGETVRDRGLTIHPTNLKGGDAFAAFQAKTLIEEIDPDLVFILHDIWYFEHYLRILGPYRDRTKIVCYIPLDGRIRNEDDAAPLERADRVVVYTDFARNEFEGAFDRLRGKRGGGGFPAVDVIPHGVDRDRFHPFPELLQASFASPGRAEAKRRVFAGLENPDGSFVVLNASRPDKRKRVDLTIEGFARFAAGKPANVRLCLHHAIMGEPEKEQIRSLVERFGLEGRLHLNPLAGGILDDRELNLLYNACDVGLTTSMGEGWGLVSFEHGAAGAAQIVPAHSACAEIWSGRAEMIPPATRYIPRFSTLEMGEVSAEGVARALDNLYGDPRRRRHLAQAAHEAALSPEYSWDAIAERFDALFAETAQR
jgi:glycosyltransferase involved in cell wall biosynthesis